MLKQLTLHQCHRSDSVTQFLSGIRRTAKVPHNSFWKNSFSKKRVSLPKKPYPYFRNCILWHSFRLLPPLSWQTWPDNGDSPPPLSLKNNDVFIGWSLWRLASSSFCPLDQRGVSCSNESLAKRGANCSWRYILSRVQNLKGTSRNTQLFKYNTF